MTNTKKKFLIFCLLLFIIFALPSQAATITELQAQINTLIVQVTSLQSQLMLAKGTASTTPAFCAGIAFNRPLIQGSYGNDVKCLQALLNQKLDTRIAISGSGSPGHETYYFGYLTKLAVIKFQNKYSSEVLKPKGLSYGTGIVGSTTRAKLNTIISVLVTVPITPTVTPPITGSGGSTMTPPTIGGGGSTVIVPPIAGGGGSTVIPTLTPVTDTTPPVRSSGLPIGTLIAGTTQTTISLATDEPSTCKYGTTAGTAYASIANTFSKTRGTTHSRTVTGLTNGSSYTYYVRCIDAANNANTNDFAISFSVSSPSCVDCGLGTPVIAPASPTANQSFTISCPTNFSGYDCIDAYANGSSNKCTFGSYSGNNVIYSCTGLTAGTYTSRCVSKTGTSRNCCASSQDGSYTVQAAPDTTAPSKITNLSTSNPTQTSVVLSWTSPGDDATTGTATSYDIRYSTASITCSNWTTATQITGEPTTLVSGTIQSVTVTGLTANTTYYFAIKANDDASNTSILSNVPSGKTLVSIIADCFGAETCNPTGNPIGGGAGYSNIILETDPSVKYVVSTKDQFVTALSQVKAGEVIFVEGDASIDMTGIYGTIIPGGITIASNRGLNGSQGGRIFQNRLSSDPKPPNWNTNYGSMLIAVGDVVRITGLRLEGPDKNTTNMESIGPKSGIFFRNVKGATVDNCEIFGWSGTGIYVNNVDVSEQAEGLAATEIGSTMANVHHNYIHHCQSDGLGYGVQIGYGSVLVKANLFEYTRHSIAAGGQPGEGYEASYNIQNDHTTSQVFDVHGYPSDGASHSAGSLFRFHHNTILSPSHSIGNSIVIRGTPLINASITFNRLHNCYVECQHGSYNGTTPNPVYQPIGGSNVIMTNNYVDDTYYESGPILQGSMGG